MIGTKNAVAISWFVISLVLIGIMQFKYGWSNFKAVLIWFESWGGVVLVLLGFFLLEKMIIKKAKKVINIPQTLRDLREQTDEKKTDPDAVAFVGSIFSILIVAPVVAGLLKCSGDAVIFVWFGIIAGALLFIEGRHLSQMIQIVKGARKKN